VIASRNGAASEAIVHARRFFFPKNQTRAMVLLSSPGLRVRWAQAFEIGLEDINCEVKASVLKNLVNY
jgi:hypothetical protein